jgi:hypothetical protein
MDMHLNHFSERIRLSLHLGLESGRNCVRSPYFPEFPINVTAVSTRGRSDYYSHIHPPSTCQPLQPKSSSQSESRAYCYLITIRPNTANSS